MFAENLNADAAVIIARARIARAQALDAVIVRAVTAIRDGLAPPAARLSARIRAWRERRAVAAELQRLDDRTLQDIGLYRGDIRWVAEAVAAGQDLRPARAATSAKIVPLPRSRPDRVEIRTAA